MTATISFITKTLSQLLNDFSQLLTKYFGTELQSRYNYCFYSMKHFYRCRVGKWVTMNSSEHFPGSRVDWHHPRLAKTCFFSEVPTFPWKGKSHLFIYFCPQCICEWQSSMKRSMEQTLTGPRFPWVACIRIIWAPVHLWESEEQLEVDV